MAASLEHLLLPLSTPQLRCEIATDFHRLMDIAADWNRIWKTSPGAEIFQRLEWIRAWWYAYGDDLSLCTPLIYRGERLVGIAPLALRNGTIRFIGSPGADYGNVLCSDTSPEDVITGMVDALTQLPFRWHSARLDNIPSDSPFAQFLPQACQRVRLPLRVFESTSCPTIHIGADREALFRQLLNRHHYRRHRNKFYSKGKVAFYHVEDRDAAVQHIARMFDQQQLRRTFCDVPSHFSEPGFRRLFLGFLKFFDLTSSLRFSVLELNGTPVAYHLGFQTPLKFLMYQQSFDVDVWDFAPGDVLLLKLLEYASEQTISEYDFGIGDEEYKLGFANGLNQNVNAHICAPGIVDSAISHATYLACKAHAYTRTEPPWLVPVLPFARRLIRYGSIARECGLWACAKSAFLDLVRLRRRSHRFRLACRLETDNGSYLVRAATLGDLARGAQTDSTTLTPQVLTRMKAELKHGMRIYAVLENGLPVFLASVKNGSADNCTSSAKDSESPPHASGASTDYTIEQLWISPAERSCSGCLALLHSLTTAIFATEFSFITDIPIAEHLAHSPFRLLADRKLRTNAHGFVSS